MKLEDMIDQLQADKEQLSEIARAARRLIEAMHRTDVKLTVVTNSHYEALNQALKAYYQP